MKILHLVLTHHWYDLTVSGEKIFEYREKTPYWKKRIWDKRGELTHVRFSKGYSSETTLRRIVDIDIMSCPYEGWEGRYYTIQSEPV